MIALFIVRIKTAKDISFTKQNVKIHFPKESHNHVEFHFHQRLVKNLKKVLCFFSQVKLHIHFQALVLKKSIKKCLFCKPFYWSEVLEWPLYSFPSFNCLNPNSKSLIQLVYANEVLQGHTCLFFEIFTTPASF